MGMTKVTGKDIQDMVGEHWLRSPVNGYLGSSYGSDTKALLQRPEADGSADAYLNKLRLDVPVIQALPPGSANLFAVTEYPDKMKIVIEIAGTAFDINKT
jgi:hypothetical protein